MFYKKTIGYLGEELAAKFLQGKGCQLLDKNFNTPFGEIDLIVKHKNEIIFVEVKTRSTDNYGYPEQAVNSEKISHLLKAIEIYLDKLPERPYWRLDIVSIRLEKDIQAAKIKWFQNILA